VIRDLVSGVSHDIRTPLLAQNMNMDLALDGAWGNIPPGISTLLEQMVQSNQSLLDLSNRLLLLSRYELNDQPMDWAFFSVADLFDEIFLDLAPLADRKALRFRSCLSPETIEGDRREMKRLFLNLLDNAIKWSPQGEEIDVSCERREGRIVVTVADRGPGIPAEMAPRLFRRFGGLHPGSGFGLGLYLAQQVARLHGGGISYRPGDPGSQFVVDLPIRRRL
jgi:signal transduction histidine kinase